MPFPLNLLAIGILAFVPSVVLGLVYSLVRQKLKPAEKQPYFLIFALSLLACSLVISTMDYKMDRPIKAESEAMTQFLNELNRTSGGTPLDSPQKKRD